MRRGGGGGRILRVALVLLVLAALLLGIAQLALPPIAASTISSRVGRYGKVDHVSVRAWPAIKLLWGRADSVEVVADDLVLTPEQTATLLHEAAGTSKLDARVATVKEGPLRLTRARLSKRGAQLSGGGTISQAAVAEALPPGVAVKLLHSAGGQVQVQVSGGLFGVGASVDAVALTEGGNLVARPQGLLLGGLRLTLFSDPRIAVEGVEAVPQATAGYRLSMRARLR